jgi:hypothetical protein
MKQTSFRLQDLRGTACKRLLACGSMVLSVLSVFRFCPRRAQNETQKEDEVPLRMITFGPLRKSCQIRKERVPMTRKQIVVSVGVVLAFGLMIAFVIFGLPAVWQMLVSMHGGG